MKFSIIHRGVIPSNPTDSDIDAIRLDRALQKQLYSLATVTAAAFEGMNRIIVNETQYNATLPISWVGSIEIRCFRSIPPNGHGVGDGQEFCLTMLRALCAPGGLCNPEHFPYSQNLYVLALAPQQFVTTSMSVEPHWLGDPENDSAVVKVATQETGFEDAMRLGGLPMRALRSHVF